MSPAAWIVLAFLWVAAGFNAGWSLRRSGRRWWLWFIISVLFSVIPAAVVAYVDYFRQLARYRAQKRLVAMGAPRCPHCGRPMSPRDLRRAGGQAVCPHCGMTFDDTTVA